MAISVPLPSAPSRKVQNVSYRSSRKSVIDRLLLPWFVVLVWGIPYPFTLAASDEGSAGVEAALNNVVSLRGILLILAWSGFAVLVLLRMLRGGQAGFLVVLLGTPAGVLWLLFILSEALSILYSPSPLLCGFRVFQVVVLNGFLIYWFYQGALDGRAKLISALVGYSAVNAAYNLAMLAVYPDAVMTRNPFDGDRLIGGWLFPPDYSVTGLLVLTFSLVSLAYSVGRGWLHMLGLSLGLGEIVFSATRGVAFAAITVMCLVPVVRSRNLVLRVAAVAAAGTVLVLVYAYAEDINAMMGRSAQTLEGFDGRSDIWATYLGDFFHQGNVMFGLGFLSGGRFLASQYPDNPFGNLHNMYLEAFVDVGAAGLMAFVGSLLMLLPSVRILQRWQDTAAGTTGGRLECRNLAFCWLMLVSLMILGIISNSLLEENSVLLAASIPYLLVMTHMGRKRRAFFHARDMLSNRTSVTAADPSGRT